MSYPTFNGFSLNDDNFITERIQFKEYAKRSVDFETLARREGVKLLGTEFRQKEVTIEGSLIASTSTELQTFIDNFKKNLRIEESSLIIETDRTFYATVESMAIPDVHYNQSFARWEVTFALSQPYSVGPSVSQDWTITSGIFTFSGNIFISGTLFARPVLTISSPGGTGNTNIKKMDLLHVESGLTVTISGFGSGGGLNYANSVTFDMDQLIGYEGISVINNQGAFARWEPGANQFTITVSGRWTGGTVLLTYDPRYL